jgi:hypothetical protein
METNVLSNGARLVRRHFRLVVWIFAVNLILAWLGSAPVKTALAELLNHSLASQRLVDRFDIGAFAELLAEKSMPMHAFATAGMHFALVFFIYTVFINGGVLTVYREDRKLSKAEFFEMSGGYFWRMVRLTLLSLIPFAILGGIYSALSSWSDKLADNAAGARTGFWVLVIGCVFIWALMLLVRIWFDVAQCITVAENERGMIRTTWRTFKGLFTGEGRLLPTYMSIHIVGIVSMMVLCFLWLRVPHGALGVTFILFELIVMIEIAVRLWQKAACMTWLKGRSVVVATPAYELAHATTTSNEIPPDAFPNPGEPSGV